MAGGYRAFYLPLKAEFFVPPGDDIEELFTKRTRFTAGLGYVVDKSWTEPPRVFRRLNQLSPAAMAWDS